MIANLLQRATLTATVQGLRSSVATALSPLSGLAQRTTGRRGSTSFHEERIQVWIGSSVMASDRARPADRKSTRLNSSHVAISYAVFCLKKKIKHLCVHS